MNFYDDLHILFGGTRIRASQWVDLKPRNYYCLQYNHAGQIQVQQGTAPAIQVTGPSLLITQPGIHYRFGTGTAQTWQHNYVSFRGKRVNRYRDSGLLPLSGDPPLFHIRDGNRFLSQMRICTEAATLGPPHQPRAAHAFEGLLLQLYEEAQLPAFEENGLKENLRRQGDAIRQDPLRDWDFSQCSEELHISYAHYRRVFQQVLGQAPHQYLLHCRLSKSAELLSLTHKPIKEIAVLIGMDDIHYFNKMFKRQYHLPPGRFRREILGNVR